LLKPADPFGAGDRNHRNSEPPGLLADPGKSHLRWRYAPGVGDLPNRVGDGLIGRRTVAAEPRVPGAEVPRAQRRYVHRPGQEPAAEWREWHKRDAELAQRVRDSRLRIPCPQ